MSPFIAGIVATLAALALVRLLHRMAPRRLARALARRRELAHEMRVERAELTIRSDEDIPGNVLIRGPIWGGRPDQLPRRLRRNYRNALRRYYLTDPEISAEWPWDGAR